MAEEMAEMVSQWALLPTDVLRAIAKRLGNGRVDTLRLRSVCKSWRSSIPPFKASFPLTLPFPISPNPSLNPKRRGHFSLNQSTIYFLQPPPSSSSSSAHHHGGGGGWLLRVEEPAEAGGNLHPLNPLSKILTERVPKAFPKSLNLLDFRISEIGRAYSLRFVDLSKQEIETSFEELKSILVKKVVVSSDGVGTDFAVMAIHGGKLGSFNLGGERKWSPIDDSKYDDVAYHKGKFYAVDYRGRLVAIGSDSKAKQIVPAGPRRYGGKLSLVKSGDDLFMVDKYLDLEQAIWYEEDLRHNLDEEDGPDSAVQLKVFKLNEEGKEWEYVQSLDGRVLFIGDDCSFAVSAQDFAALKENCIYFSEDTFYHCNEGEKLGEFCVDTGVQCMEDDRCGPLSMFPDHWSIFWPPPAWLKPKPTPTRLVKK